MIDCIDDSEMIDLDLEEDLDLDPDLDLDLDLDLELDPLSPRSPTELVYFVQSPPSSDSHDGSDKLLQSTPSSESSPLRSSSSWHSMSSRSRFSSRSWKLNWKRFPVIQEVEEKWDVHKMFDKWRIRRWHCWILLLLFVFLFTVFCLVIGAVSRPYRPRVAMKMLTINNFYYGEGSDYAGVPTKYLTVNCSVEFAIFNPATFFGIHVSFTPADLFYYEITVATGQFQLKKYYQPRKSHHIVSVNLEGKRVPLYGAGMSLAVSDNRGGVPCRLEFGIRSRANVVGMLVRTKHRMHISCSLVVNSRSTKAIKFKEDPCTYD